jgi:hypothetical protein
MSTLPTKEGLMKWVDDVAVELDLDPRATLVLTKFASYADASAQSWAAVKTLARQGRSSERKIQYLLRDFEAAGLIRKTGEMHRLPDSTREVPMYEFMGYLESLAAPASMGARRAPIEGHGCTDGGGMGAQGVHPHNEPIEHTPSDEGDARAREAVFGRVEAAYPKRGLGFTNRPRALAAFLTLIGQGVDGEKLVAAAAAFALDRAGKATDQSLEFWLSDGKYRGWWPEARADEAVPAVSATPERLAAPDADCAVWRTVDAAACAALTESEYGSYLRRSFLALAGGQLLVVAATGVARDWIAQRCWRRIEGWWAAADAAKRPLKLVSKLEFEALSRQAEGVG